MNFMSVNLPYPTSSLIDVLSILEAASEPVKLKKIVKELHDASIKFNEAKSSYDEKFSDIEKKILEISAKEEKLAASELKISALKERQAIETAEFKKLSIETLAKKAEVEALEKSFESKRLSQETIFGSKEDSLAQKFAEADNRMVSANALIKEYQEKLAKLKAVMS